MKCAVCDAPMTSLVCSCGYDASRNYQQYPVFGPVGDALPVSVLRSRYILKSATEYETNTNDAVLPISHSEENATAESKTPEFNSVSEETVPTKNTAHKEKNADKDSFGIKVLGCLLAPFYCLFSLFAAILHFLFILGIIAVIGMFLIQKITGIPVFMIVRVFITTYIKEFINLIF